MHLKRLLASITMFIILVTGMPIQAYAAYDAGTSEVQLGETKDIIAQSGNWVVYHEWASENPDIAEAVMNWGGKSASVTGHKLGETTVTHRYRTTIFSSWSEEKWRVTVTEPRAKFFILKAAGIQPGSSGDQGQFNYYPNASDTIAVGNDTYTEQTGLPGFLTVKGYRRVPNVGDEYFALGEENTTMQETMIREPARQIMDALYQKAGLEPEQTIVWYAIKKLDDGYHVDGYVSNIPVDVIYHRNAPVSQPDDAEDTYIDEVLTSPTYHIRSLEDCAFTAPKGYRFTGWKLETGTTYQQGEIFSLSHGVTFTAQWEETPDLPVNEGGTSDYVVVETPDPVEPDAATQGTATVKVYRDGTYLADQSFPIQFAGQSANIRFSARDTVSGEQIGTDYVLSSAAVIRAEGTQPDTEIEQIDYMGLGTVTRLHDGDTLYLLYSSTFTVNGTVEIDGNTVDFERIRKENSDQNRKFIDWLNRRYVMNYGLGTGTAAIVYGGDRTDSRLIAKDTQPPFDTDVDLRSGQLLTEVTIGSKTYTLEGKKLQIRSGDSYETVLPGAEEEHINLDQSDYLKKRSGDLRVIETAMAHNFVFDLKIQARLKAETFTLYAGFADDGTGLSAQQLDEYAKDGVHIQPGWEQLDLVKGQPHSVEWIAPDGYVITGYQENATAQVTSLLHDNQGVARFRYDTTGTDETTVHITAYLAADHNGDLVPDVAQVRFTYQSADLSKGSLIGNMDEYVNKQDGTAHPHAIPQPVAQPGYVFAYWQTDDLTDPDIAMGTFRATAYTKDTVFTAHFVPDHNHDGIADGRQVFVRYVSADTECGTVQGTDQVINLGEAAPWIQVQTVPAEAQAKDSYVFDHWTVDYGDRTLSDGQVLGVQTFDRVAGGTVITFTAHFRPEQVYQLTFQTVYGTIAGGSQFVMDVQERALAPGHAYVPKLPANIVIDASENMVFLHWSQESPQDKVYRESEETIPEACNVVFFDNRMTQTLYAVWAADSNQNGIPDTKEARYRVTYAWSGQPAQAQLPQDSKTYLAGATVTLDTRYRARTVIHAEKDGVPGIYTFLGWNGIGEREEQIKMPAHDLVLQGSWQFEADRNADGITDTRQIVIRYLCREDTYGKVEQSEQILTYTPEEVAAAGRGELPERQLTARAIAGENGRFQGWSSDGLGKQLWPNGEVLDIPVKLGVDQLGQTVTVTAHFTAHTGGGARHPEANDAGKDGSNGKEDKTEIDKEVVDIPDDVAAHGVAARTLWLNTKDHYAYLIGYAEDGTVRPNASITRAEVATIFFRLLTDEARDQFWMTSNSFSDVSPNDWYNNAISTMVNLGVICGYEDGTFRPNARITRAEFAAIATRFMNGQDTAAQDLFADIMHHWARRDINIAAAAGWVHGYENNVFAPDLAMTRAEVATVINNMLGRKPHADYMLDGMTKWPDNPRNAWYYEAIQEATNSHDYTMTDDHEVWTALRDNIDWAAAERDWTNRYRAGSGG